MGNCAWPFAWNNSVRRCFHAFESWLFSNFPGCVSQMWRLMWHLNHLKSLKLDFEWRSAPKKTSWFSNFQDLARQASWEAPIWSWSLMEIVWQEAVMFGSNMAPCQVIKIVFLLEDLVSFTMFYQVLHLHLCCYCMLPGISVLAQPFFPCLSMSFLLFSNTWCRMFGLG